MCSLFLSLSQWLTSLVSREQKREAEAIRGTFPDRPWVRPQVSQDHKVRGGGEQGVEWEGGEGERWRGGGRSGRRGEGGAGGEKDVSGRSCAQLKRETFGGTAKLGCQGKSKGSSIFTITSSQSSRCNSNLRNYQSLTHWLIRFPDPLVTWETWLLTDSLTGVGATSTMLVDTIASNKKWRFKTKWSQSLQFCHLGSIQAKDTGKNATQRAEGKGGEEGSSSPFPTSSSTSTKISSTLSYYRHCHQLKTIRHHVLNGKVCWNTQWKSILLIILITISLIIIILFRKRKQSPSTSQSTFLLLEKFFIQSCSRMRWELQNCNFKMIIGAIIWS